MNRYKLSKEVREEYLPKVLAAIAKIEGTDEMIEISFSDTKLNPYTLGLLLEEQGYDRIDIDHNGWEMDFWITYAKDNAKTISLNGCGITFSMYLTWCP